MHSTRERATFAKELSPAQPPPSASALLPFQGSLPFSPHSFHRLHRALPSGPELARSLARLERPNVELVSVLMVELSFGVRNIPSYVH